MASLLLDLHSVVMLTSKASEIQQQPYDAFETQMQYKGNNEHWSSSFLDTMCGLFVIIRDIPP